MPREYGEELAGAVVAAMEIIKGLVATTGPSPQMS
jgi:hypothetical protein